MQRFREAESTTTAAPVYDSDTVRQVLARAAEIESRPESDVLTAAQIEALGIEVGLSSEAVRRALGETAGVNHNKVVSSRAVRGQGRQMPLTQEQVKAALLPTLWYILLGFPVLFGVSRSMQSGAMPNAIGMTLIIWTAAVAPLLLAFRSGYLLRRAKIGATGGIITVLLALVISVLAILSSSEADETVTALPGMVILCLLALGASAGAFGAVTRRWWDGLPRNADVEPDR